MKMVVEYTTVQTTLYVLFARESLNLTSIMKLNEPTKTMHNLEEYWVEK